MSPVFRMTTTVRRDINACRAGFRPTSKSSLLRSFSTVPGFYMCCSGSSRRTLSHHLPKTPLPTDKFASQPKCPMDLTTNGQRCVVNEIEGCPSGYVCIGRGPRGVCCRAQPKCARRGRRPFYLANKQVTLAVDERECNYTDSRS